MDNIKDVYTFKKNINVHIIRDNNPNAFVTPNNKLIISSGLIQQSPDYVSLLAVLAHEIGHYKKGHIPKMIAISALMIHRSALLTLGPSPSTTTTFHPTSNSLGLERKTSLQVALMGIRFVHQKKPRSSVSLETSEALSLVLKSKSPIWPTVLC